MGKINLNTATDEEIEKYCNEKYKDLPHGSYQIGEGPWVIFTGRGGYILSEIALMKAVRDMNKPKRYLP